MSLNRVTAVGRLVRDPEMRTTTTGKSVVSFTIAVQKRIKPTNGDPDADFFRVTAWGQTAEFVNSYLTKGRLISIDGRLESRKFTDSAGNSREVVEIVADNVSGLDKPRDDDGGGSTAPRVASHAASHAAPQLAADEYDPFADE
jgi:single-strand DNA-binding protein